MIEQKKNTVAASESVHAERRVLLPPQGPEVQTLPSLIALPGFTRSDYLLHQKPMNVGCWINTAALDLDLQ